MDRPRKPCPDCEGRGYFLKPHGGGYFCERCGGEGTVPLTDRELEASGQLSFVASTDRAVEDRAKH